METENAGEATLPKRSVHWNMSKLRCKALKHEEGWSGKEKEDQIQDSQTNAKFTKKYWFLCAFSHSEEKRSSRRSSVSNISINSASHNSTHTQKHTRIHSTYSFMSQILRMQPPVETAKSPRSSRRSVLGVVDPNSSEKFVWKYPIVSVSLSFFVFASLYLLLCIVCVLEWSKFTTHIRIH